MSQVIPDAVYTDEIDETALEAAFRIGDFPDIFNRLRKIGLILAAVFGDVTVNVIGTDIDPEVLDGVKRCQGQGQREPGIPELLETNFDRTRDIYMPSLEDFHVHQFHTVFMMTPHFYFEVPERQRIDPSSGQLTVIGGSGSTDLIGTKHQVYTVGGAYV